ncbi:MAG TPA: DUF4230 domain-containing protein [Anaeromyxobacteraceae bacterium]|nr:DUF4230 domain-containing protein [Anaeromyxobacteraceae bacterium]
MRRLLSLAVLGLAVGLGAAFGYRLLARPGAPLPDPPSVVERVREVSRLVALDLAVYKKVSFAPEPAPAGSFWGDVAGWIVHTVRAPSGKAIVFADAHVGLDLSRLDASSVLVAGREVFLVLPPLEVTIELRPGETEVIGSNLDSAETAKLFELAREAFQREVEADGAVRARARDAAERAIRALLLEAGFEAVHFVEELPGRRGS